MTGRIHRRAAVALTATGVLFLVGVILHPHAPNAHDMAQVAYTQTGQVRWWPAHLLLLSSYVLFAVFIFSVSRLDGLASPTRRALSVARPIAVLCVLAMAVHLLLPLGRASVANSHHGWAFWVKDVVESADALWALCVATIAWLLSRAGVIGYRVALLGVVGGIGFAVFSALVPLTGVLVPMRATRSLLHVLPVFAILIVTWAVLSGVSAPANRVPA
jgi:hypothetical protein